MTDNVHPSPTKKIYTATITVSLFMIFFGIFSVPLLQFGFSGDDLYNSLVKGILIIKHQTIFAFTKEIIIGWLNSGRLYLIPFITTYPLFYLIGDNVILYNIIHWIATLISLGFVCLFLYKFTNKKGYILIFCSLLPVCWFLSPNSPWVAQAFLLPLVTSFSMLTLINYISFIQKGETRYLFYMLFSFSLSLVTYEIAIVVPPIIIVIHWWAKEYDIKRKLLATSSILLLTLLYFGITLYLRQIYGAHYEGTSLGSIHNSIPTFLKQFVAEFPLMNLYFFYDLLSYGFFPTSKTAYFIALLLMIYSTALIYKQFNYASEIPRSRYIFVISLLLQIIPASLVAVSKRYQQELMQNMILTHIPVLFQQIGFCLMLALIFNNAFSFLSKYSNKKLTSLKLIFAIVIGSVIGSAFLANKMIANWYNHTTRYSREIYENALRKGLFNDLPAHAMIIINNFAGAEYCWNSTQLRAQLINREDILLFDLNGKAPLVDNLYEEKFSKEFSSPSADNFYYLDYAHLAASPKSGYALLAHINHHKGTQPHLNFELDNIKIIYFANSEKDLKELLDKISNKYKFISFKNHRDKNPTALANISGYITIPNKHSFSV